MSYDITEPFEYVDSPEQLARVHALPVDPEVEKVRQALARLTPKGPGLAKTKVAPTAQKAARLARRWEREGFDSFWLDGLRPVPAALNELPPNVPAWPLNTPAGVRHLERVLAA